MKQIDLIDWDRIRFFRESGFIPTPPQEMLDEALASRIDPKAIPSSAESLRTASFAATDLHAVILL